MQKVVIQIKILPSQRAHLSYTKSQAQREQYAKSNMVGIIQQKLLQNILLCQT